MTKGSYDYETPYADLLPPLSTAEFEALKLDIGANGQRVPIMVTPDGRVVDGHHRLRVCRELGLVPIKTEVAPTYAKALALVMNINRRNLSPDEMSMVRHQQQQLAAEMAEDGCTQVEIGAALGVDQSTVARWLSETNMQSHKSFRPDNRVKVPPKARPEIVARVEGGDSLVMVARDYGVTHTAIRKIVNAEKAKQAEAAARSAKADKLLADAQGDGWKMLHGDFRERLLELEPGSVDLIVTDPPYPAKFLPLWADLSEVAAKVLKPQGVLLAMSGKIHLDQVMRHLGSHLSYGWVYCLPLERGLTRIMARHVMQEWKPWLAYSNGTYPSGRIQFHGDRLDSGAREKGRYRWEQDPTSCRYMLEVFLPEGGVVVDPFAGTAAFGVAALESGCTFIGVELDAERFKGCVDRLNGDA